MALIGLSVGALALPSISFADPATKSAAKPAVKPIKPGAKRAIKKPVIKKLGESGPVKSIEWPWWRVAYQPQFVLSNQGFAVAQTSELSTAGMGLLAANAAARFDILDEVATNIDLSFARRSASNSAGESSSAYEIRLLLNLDYRFVDEDDLQAEVGLGVDAAQLPVFRFATASTVLSDLSGLRVLGPAGFLRGALKTGPESLTTALLWGSFPLIILSAAGDSLQSGGGVRMGLDINHRTHFKRGGGWFRDYGGGGRFDMFTFKQTAPYASDNSLRLIQPYLRIGIGKSF